ncbi:hypothetical protein E6H34_11390 [Candidatus Bathyarchaeota archaeon]|nr:MAG: hypothetical protein E6H34_11390 [Candidatus Bathyarchaeota archaeon]
MLEGSATSLPYHYDPVFGSLTRRAHPVPEWILLYQNGSSTTKIAGQYHVGASTVARHLRRRIPLRDRVSASIIASTKYPKIPFSGDQREGAFLAGLIEEFHVRRAGRLVELGTTTTHPAMTHLFHDVFSAYGNPTSSPSYEARNGYYRYFLSVYLHESFGGVLTKSINMPGWIPRSKDDPVFESYLSGLIAAEGCVRLYDSHGRADSVLHITLNKPHLLGELSHLIGGRLYEVQRAYCLVIYGKASVNLLRRLNLRHDEKVRKSRLMIAHTGERWAVVEPYWNEMVCSIKLGVKGPTAPARLDYIAKYGAPHPDEDVGNERS